MSALISEILRRRRCQETGKMNIVPDIVPDIVVFLRCRSAHHMSTNGLSLRHRRHIVVLDYDIGADIVVQTYDIVVFCYDVVVFFYDVVYRCRSFFALRYRIRCTDSHLLHFTGAPPRRPSGDSDDDNNGDREMDENDMRDFKFEDQNFIPPSCWDL